MKKLLFFMLLVMVVHLSPIGIEEEDFRKAGMVGIISKYIDWPDNSSLNEPSKPFIIGLIGDDPFTSVLEFIFVEQGEKIKEKNVEIIKISNLDDIKNCHLLFIFYSVEKDIKKILDITKNMPVLTIGETKGFAEKGVLFNLYLSKGALRFEINSRALRQTKLKVNSRLLKVAGRIVNQVEENK